MSGLIVNPYSFGAASVPLGTILVGSETSSFVGALTTTAVDLTSLGAVENDLVVFTATSDDKTGINATAADAPATQGWTLKHHYNGDWPPSMLLYKLMGATPDTSITITNGSSSGRMAYHIMVLRGVDPASPDEGSSALTALLTSTTLTFNSITTVTDNALIYAYGGLKNDNSTVTSFTAGWDSGFQNTGNQGGGNDSTLGWGRKFKTPAGLEAGPVMVYSSSDSVRGRSLTFKPRTV